MGVGGGGGVAGAVEVLGCEEALWFYSATFEVKSFVCILGTRQLSVFAAPHLVNCFKEDTKFEKIPLIYCGTVS